MKTTTVALGSHFDEFIQASVHGGRYTIEEGEASGYVEDFDFESHLEELKAKRKDNG